MHKEKLKPISNLEELKEDAKKVKEALSKAKGHIANAQRAVDHMKRISRKLKEGV